jgi:hypothetical protein
VLGATPLRVSVESVPLVGVEPSVPPGKAEVVD